MSASENILLDLWRYYESKDSTNFESSLQRLILSKLSRSIQISIIEGMVGELSNNYYWSFRWNYVSSWESLGLMSRLLRKLQSVIAGKSYYILSLMPNSLDNTMRLNNLHFISENNNLMTKPSILTVLVNDTVCSNSIQNTWYIMMVL
eukprot:166285_1